MVNHIIYNNCDCDASNGGTTKGCDVCKITKFFNGKYWFEI